MKESTLNIKDEILKKIGEHSFITASAETQKIYFCKEISKDNFDRSKYEQYKKLKNKNILELRERIPNLEKDEFFCIYSMYCNYGCLLDYLNYRKENQLEIRENFIRHIINQIIDGLKYLHNNNISYGNLSLNEIFINNSEDFIRKEDFIKEKNYLKLSYKNSKIKIQNPILKKEIIQNGFSSRKFISPELEAALKENRSLNNDPKYKADLWSLGIITYQLLILNLDFDYDELINRIKRHENIIPSKIRASREIIDFINSLLKLNPNERMKLEEIKNHAFLKQKALDQIENEIKKLKKEKLKLQNQISDKLEEILSK
jgi:serine/threonine protein kinase